MKHDFNTILQTEIEYCSIENVLILIIHNIENYDRVFYKLAYEKGFRYVETAKIFNEEIKTSKIKVESYSMEIFYLRMQPDGNFLFDEKITKENISNTIRVDKIKTIL